MGLQYVSLSISDNGKGIDAKDRTHWGIGLTNIESRVKYFDESFEINSIKKIGTEITLSVPI